MPKPDTGSENHNYHLGEKNPSKTVKDHCTRFRKSLGCKLLEAGNVSLYCITIWFSIHLRQLVLVIIKRQDTWLGRSMVSPGMDVLWLL